MDMIVCDNDSRQLLPAVLSNHPEPVDVVYNAPFHLTSLLARDRSHVLSHVHENLFPLTIGESRCAECGHVWACRDQTRKCCATGVSVTQNPRVNRPI